MFGSPFVSAALRHRVQIPFHFGGSPTSCSNLLSFQWLFGIMSRSPIVLVALRHRVWIPFLFGGSPTLCPDPLSFWRLSGIVFESFIISTTLRHHVQISYHFGGYLWHRVRIPYRFGGSPASCPDLLSFQQLSDIVSGSPFFSKALRHRV